MSKLKPMDIAFLAMENSNRLMHMTAYQLFELPAKGQEKFVTKLLNVFRGGEVAKPFNQKLKWLGNGVASWEKYEPDLKYHVRHIAVPKPGRMEQFYELISFINTPQLDRAYPLWECYVIEGLENNRLAILTKIHHSLVDGEGGLKLFRDSLSDSAKDKEVRAMWTPGSSSAAKSLVKGSKKSELGKLISKFNKLPSNLIDISSGLTNMSAQALGLKPKMASLPFGAKKTLFNHTATSSARRYANCELSFDRVKAVGKATSSTINDVVMTVIDEGLHLYLNEQDHSVDDPLVAMMAMSLRSANSQDGGNQVCVQLVEMGQPQASLLQRLKEVAASTSKIKNESKSIPASVLQFYTLLVTGGATLADMTPAMDSVPSSNLTISNMVGPREQLYLAGAPMIGFHGLPIVPPGAGLNVTFASVHNTICLGIGATPEAVSDPFKLIQFITHSFDELEKITFRTQSNSSDKRRIVGKQMTKRKKITKKAISKKRTTK